MQENFDRKLYRDSIKTDFVAVVLSLIATILLHITAYFAIPQEFTKPKIEDKKTDELKIEVLPPKIKRKLPDFIEANPFANNEKPSTPDAPESFKDQRAADEMPDPSSKSKKPFVDGELKDGKKIVSGTSADKDDFSPAKVIETLNRPLKQPAQPTDSPEQPAQPISQTESQQNANNTDSPSQEKTASSAPAKKSDKTESIKKEQQESEKGESQKDNAKENKTAKLDEDGFIKVEKHSKNVPDKKSETKKGDKIAKGQKTSPDSSNKNVTNLKPQEQIDKQERKISQSARDMKQTPSTPEKPPQPENQQEDIPAPRPRPSLSMKIPAGPLAENRSHASTRGVVACDSRFSEFGAYQQRMIEAISRQWNLLASKYDLSTAVGSFVIIEYYLNTIGELSRFKIIHTTSTNTGTGLCEQSILTTAPYGEWTQEMVDVFGGQDQSVRITFHYR